MPRNTSRDNLGRFERIHDDPKQGRRNATRNYERKPEVKAKKAARRYLRTKEIRATAEGKAQRAAWHQVKRADPEYMRKRKAANDKRRQDPAVRERMNYLKRFHRSGLSPELFEIQDLNNRLKSKIHELRKPKKDAIR